MSDEGTEHRDLGGSSDEAGEAGGGSGAPPETDPDVKDAGPPPDGPADPEGTSGAEEGISPWAPEAYDADAVGPTQSTED